MKNTKALVFAAIMAALANILSFPPISIPISLGTFETSIHFSQLPILISGILAGPMSGMIAGAAGGLYMSFTRIPFIVGGLAILGCAAGLLAKRFSPFLSGILAWCVQAPYVLVTDYVWFAFFMRIPQIAIWTIIIPIMAILTAEAVICSFLAQILTRYVKKAGISF